MEEKLNLDFSDTITFEKRLKTKYFNIILVFIRNNILIQRCKTENMFHIMQNVFDGEILNFIVIHKPH